MISNSKFGAAIDLEHVCPASVINIMTEGGNK